MTTGYLTQTDLVNLKIFLDATRINTERIKDLITSDLSSDAKRKMAEGKRYYDAKHDILDHVNYYWIDGSRQTDAVSANNKLPHPFHRMLVDQKVAYVAGNPPVITVAGPDILDEDNPSPTEGAAKSEADKFQTLLIEQLDEGFDDLLNDWIEGASNKGVEWVHFYFDGAGKFNYIIVPAEQVIPVYDTQYDEKLVFVIRFYVYELITGTTREDRYKVEIWSENEVEYWVETAGGKFVRDPDYPTNPFPHWQTINTLTKKGEAKSWGRVPFVPLPNNSQWKTDLEPIKALIDAYDKVKSGWLNNLDDFAELIYVLKGFTGLRGEAQAGYSELALFMDNLKRNRAIGVESDGAVTNLKNEIPIEARTTFLDITRREIFYFGRGVDTDSDRFGGNTTGIGLQFLYASLDQKANQAIRKLKAALKEFMWFVVEYLNNTTGKKYDFEQVIFTINKSMIFNEGEKISNLKASEGMLSRKTLLEHHPYVDDADEEEARIEAEKADKPPVRVETPDEEVPDDVPVV